MELTLVHQDKLQISVTCNGQYSHAFDLHPLQLPQGRESEHLQTELIAYGQALYAALFPVGSHARQELEQFPERIVLITEDDDVDAIPWEYAYGPDDFLVKDFCFVRSLPLAQQQKQLPALETGLHIVAVPSQPLDERIPPLNIDAEWWNLKESVASSALALERLRPPTIKQLRAAVAGQRQRVVHFMGHGGQTENGAILCFEQDNGSLDNVTAKEIATRLRGTTFLVTLNACVSASPGPTLFSNLAQTLVRQRIPYALGMRFSIYDDDARLFAQTFYSDLARGVPVEEALLQARLTLASESKRPWMVGIPILYTSLAAAAPGFVSQAGQLAVLDRQPPLEVLALPRAEGGFQGHIKDLRELGQLLTGDARPRIVTIHAGGGQGKTALAREVVERFAWAWPDGVWSTTLEDLPDRAFFAAALARFLGLPQDITDPQEIERWLFAMLTTRHLLVILDNAETLVEAVEANVEKALQLTQLLQQLPSTSVSLLVTSRILLGWPGEVGYELEGLKAEEGAQLFRQSCPERQGAFDKALAQELSQEVEGHPLSLRLLGGAFNFSTISLQAFVQQCEARLVEAENKYLGPEHRHRKLYACIETSVRALNDELRDLLKSLSIFHAPFLAESAVAIFDPDGEDTESKPSAIRSQLHALWLRGLLTRRDSITSDGSLDFYYVLPTTRPYIEQHMQGPAVDQDALQRFGKTYAGIVRFINNQVDRTPLATALEEQTVVDLARGMDYVEGIEQARYKSDWAWILHRLGGQPQYSLKLLEEALEEVQGRDQDLVVMTLNNMALIYGQTGKPQEALALYKEALTITREVGNRAREAKTLNNIASIYGDTGKTKDALSLYKEALTITREVGDSIGEAATLSNMALIYGRMGKPLEALALYKKALPITREVENRIGETTILNNIALIYENIGKPKEALALFKEVLPMRRETGDRAGEVAALSNIAATYRDIGKPLEALALYKETIPITREIRDRAGEATILSNMALIYGDTGKTKDAFALYEEVLPIIREIGDRAGEATILNSMAVIYRRIGKPGEAFALYEEVLPIRREVGDRAGEAVTLSNMAALLYQAFNHVEEAIACMEQAIAILQQTGLPQDAAGQTLEQYYYILHIMRNSAH